MKQRLEEIHSIQQRELSDLRATQQLSSTRLHQSIRRIGQQPAVLARSSNEVSNIPPTAPSPPPRLSSRPKDLYELYREYQFGVGGMKAARFFTAAERGMCRYTYSLRLGFWKIVDSLIRKGHTADTAVDSVYAAYGASLPVVTILRSIREDKKRGGHPSLR
jgi:hypothetical protein